MSKPLAKSPHQDSQYDQLRYQTPEIEHRYGKNIHILANPLLLTRLAKLCSEKTTQPLINELIESLYSSLLDTVINQEFPQERIESATRMASTHPEAVYRGPAIKPETPAISVNLARAGTLPSHVCYSALNYLLNPLKVRQDHISIARTTNTQEKVTGSHVSGHKIGGDVEGAVVLIPDPMGATGGTVVQAVELYKNRGRALKYIALHCIVTPEYLRKIQLEQPDLIVYAIRLDRGLSPKEVLDSVPGTHWERERGLNDKQYIVPGGGGFGEILNNAYV